jgi:hypothetical protein
VGGRSRRLGHRHLLFHLLLFGPLLADRCDLFRAPHPLARHAEHFGDAACGVVWREVVNDGRIELEDRAQNLEGPDRRFGPTRLPCSERGTA